jgi:hypothetical protein
VAKKIGVPMDKHVIYAGMPRTGSTYLFYSLQKHPGIFISSLKELNHFLTINYKDNTFADYEAHFSGIKAGEVSFDISPPYFLEPQSTERIRRQLPDAKVILCVRDPIEYALSFYYQFKSLDNNVCSFENFLEGEYVFKKFGVNIRFTNNYIVDTIQTFRDVFGKNVLIVSYDYYRKDFLKLFHAMDDFIGIPHFFNPGNMIPYRINASSRPSVAVFNKYLFKPSVKNLARRIFPRKLIHAAGSIYNRISGVKKDEQYYTPQELELATAKMTPQAEIVSDMFAGSQVIKG